MHRSKITFSDALRYHLDRTQMSQADVIRISGVPPNVIKKLVSRHGASTAIENGIAIAAAFNLTIERFMALETPESMTLEDTFSILPPEDQTFILKSAELAIFSRTVLKKSLLDR